MINRNLYNNDGEMSALADIYQLSVSVLERPIMDKTKLDTIAESQAHSSDVIERMRFIEEKTKLATDELVSFLPQEYDECSYDKKLAVCENLKYQLAKAIECYTTDIYCANPFRFRLGRGSKESLEQISKEWDVKWKPRVREFRACREVDLLMTDVKRMMYLLMNGDFENRKKLMDNLLLLVDAAFCRTAEFWTKWRQEAADIEHGIPLTKILSEMFNSQDKEKEHFEICKRLLPEVIATYYVTCFDACSELLSILTGEKAKCVECRDSVYRRELYELGYDVFIRDGVPLSEDIHLFHGSYTWLEGALQKEEEGDYEDEFRELYD